VPTDILPQELGKEIYIEGRVIDDEGICFMPRNFTIESESEKLKVATYFWHFYYAIKEGDKVGVYGTLSKDGKNLLLHDRRMHGIKIKNGS
jgi:hypothetical protein